MARNCTWLGGAMTRDQYDEQPSVHYAVHGRQHVVGRFVGTLMGRFVAVFGALVLVLAAPVLSSCDTRLLATAHAAHVPATAAHIRTPAPNPTPTTGVQGDDGRDVYRGSGGVLIPARHWRGDSSGRRQAAECIDCSWRMTTACTSLQFDTGSCPASHVGCPRGLIRVRVWLKHGSGPWVLVGYACVGGAPPVTRSVVERSVHDASVAALPRLKPSYQPSSGALSGLPVVFSSGQSSDGLRQADLSVLGLEVRLDAQPRWTWSWGDGTSMSTSDPGGRYPRMAVSHTYLRTGHVRVVAAARWFAQYWVEGLGPYLVPGADLSQAAAVIVDVVPAHSVLTG